MPATGKPSRRASTRSSSSVPTAEARARAILDTVRAIPRGRVSTYGAVASRAGLPRQARLVGRVLGQLPAGSRVPWHRVVAAGGRIAFPAGSEPHRVQRARLAAEGVDVAHARIDLTVHGWGAPGDADLDRWLWSPPAEPADSRDVRMQRPRTKAV